MKRYCYTLDLKKDESLKKEYIKHHKKVWPEILKNIKSSGILNLEIYNINYRLFMLIEAENKFDEKKKQKMDSENPIVQKWETKMWEYQKKIKGSSKGEKWVKLNRIFNLD